ncbi:GNAT family N-acetyltransferase [Sinobaca sp. H24]|uniref:GNAT family N-acetyltransferase n=1 Tax=Sinobaca sp. H24 TaxID=2923376 RepID=UPI00207A38F6|nr:GNAT family N-acetyltransferase [Sinobaca sp. H24]
MTASFPNSSIFTDAITFRPFERQKDEAMLLDWMHKPHVIPYWHLNLSKTAFSRHLDKALSDTHQRLWIGLYEGIPMSYWETYQAKKDIVARFYHPHPSDEGVHLLFGPETHLGRGLALPFLAAMTNRLFSENPNTEKVMAEPDIRNEKMIHIFYKCGYEPIKPIQLPDKTGLLMACRRDSFKKAVEMYESS